MTAGALELAGRTLAVDAESGEIGRRINGHDRSPYGHGVRATPVRILETQPDRPLAGLGGFVQMWLGIQACRGPGMAPAGPDSSLGQAAVLCRMKGRRLSSILRTESALWAWQ